MARGGVARFAFAIFAGAVMMAPFAARSQNAVDFPPDPPETPEKPEKAVDDCLTVPGGEAPSGQRWAYRIERGTQRHCWYLRDRTASQSTAILAPVAKPLARTVDGASQRSLMQVRPNTDARAELPTARGRFEADNPLLPRTTPATIGRTPPIKAADDDVRGGMSSTPQPLDTFSAPPPAADSSVTDANEAVADSSSNPVTSGAPTPMTAPDASLRPDAAPPKTSLQRLLIAIFGALAFAGVTASLIHRFAFIWRKRRARLRRRTMWQSAKKVRARAPQATSAQTASALTATSAQTTTAQTTTAQAAGPQATSPQSVAADQANPTREDARNQQDDDAQGQIEELLGTIAKRAKREIPSPASALAKLANSQAAAAAPGQRSSARRGVRA
jgi:hypothetical protein